MNTGLIYKASHNIKGLCMVVCYLIVLAFIVYMANTVEQVDLTVLADKVTCHPAFINLQNNFMTLCERVKDIFDPILNLS